MDTTTTLGRRCASDGLPVALLEYLSEQAEIARRTFTNGGGVHIEAIESFRNWLTSHNDLDDPRLWALWTLQGAGGDASGFTPTDLQADLIARLGTSGPVPDPSSTLSELVAAGIEDAITAERAEQQRIATERETALEEARAGREAQEQAEQLRQELKEARETIDGLNGDKQELTGQVNFLRRLVGDDGDAAGEPATEADPNADAGDGTTQGPKPRRVAVEGHTGVYIDGRREETFYEIGFRNADKKQKWEPVGPDLEEAVARREERVDEVAGQKEPVSA